MDKDALTSGFRTGYKIDLGLIDYERAWDLQHLLWQKRVDGLLPDLLLFLEHPHVTPKAWEPSHLLVPQEIWLKKVPVFHIERGRHHLSQQDNWWSSDFRPKGYRYRVVKYVDQLEEVVIEPSIPLESTGKRIPDRGVWVGKERSPP
jgi:lipoate-protein ligase B